MRFVTHHGSPVGRLLLASDGQRLTGLWLEGQKFYAEGLAQDAVSKDDLPVFTQAKNWLDEYFGGEQPDPAQLPLNPSGTEFQQMVWRLLLEIPYGKVVAYGELAKRYERRTGKKAAARAVGGAVGRNPISIIVPCHRVVGADGSLTGYAGGTERKTFLLEHETASSGR